MSRGLPEWIGKTDDAKVPPRVRLRIFEREGGICWLSGRKIMPGERWDLDHKVALCNGGRHAEDNLAPALVAPHMTKTKADLKIKAKIYRIQKRHLGISAAKGRPMPGSRASGLRKKMDGTVERRT